MAAAAGSGPGIQHTGPRAADLQDLPPYAGPRAAIGILGGSGLYSFLDDAEEVAVETPWGPPSDALSIAEVAGRRVAFLPRHGRGHRFPAHRVNYRANVWALRLVGVRQILAPAAVGSLRPELGPGTLVVPDQVVDRTWGRAHTFFDAPDGAVHVTFGDPYCDRGRAAVLAAAAAAGARAVDGGTLIVVNGPRFSSRAESRWHAAAGWTVVGMTGMPEAALARELALCYTSVALVTDLDAGIVVGHGVTQEEVLRVFAENMMRLRDLLRRGVQLLPSDQGDCPCASAHEGVSLPFVLP